MNEDLARHLAAFAASDQHVPEAFTEPPPPTCYVCGREIDSLRVTWAHRDGALRSLHRACVRPTPRVHGVVVR